MSTDKYTKHLRSKHKKWVLTDPSGKVLLSTNDPEELAEFHKIVRAKKEKLLAQLRASKAEESVPKYDPFTGEPLE